jgi:hypothetical protein
LRDNFPAGRYKIDKSKDAPDMDLTRVAPALNVPTAEFKLINYLQESEIASEGEIVETSLNVTGASLFQSIFVKMKKEKKIYIT